MICKVNALDKLDIENIDIQSPLGGNLGIQLPQRTGGSISGIGKKGFTLFLLPLIQQSEALFRHKYLAPNDQSGRRVFDGHGDRPNGFQVFRNILAHIAVTTGCSTDKSSVHIFQGH